MFAIETVFIIVLVCIVNSREFRIVNETENRWYVYVCIVYAYVVDYVRLSIHLENGAKMYFQSILVSKRIVYFQCYSKKKRCLYRDFFFFRSFLNIHPFGLHSFINSWCVCVCVFSFSLLFVFPWKCVSFYCFFIIKQRAQLFFFKAVEIK